MESSLLFILAMFALVLFMFLQSRKRKKQMVDLQSRMLPGVEVMTSFGVFGVIVSLNDNDNKVVLETGKDQTLTVHRQALVKIIDSADGVVLDSEQIVASVEEKEVVSEVSGEVKKENS